MLADQQPTPAWRSFNDHPTSSIASAGANGIVKMADTRWDVRRRLRPGQIVNPRLARWPCVGGMTDGIRMALMEQTVLDPRDIRVVAVSLAEEAAAGGSLRRVRLFCRDTRFKDRRSNLSAICLAEVDVRSASRACVARSRIWIRWERDDIRSEVGSA